MTDSNLNDLCPELRPLAMRFVELCVKSGLKCRISTTWRDPVAQNAAKASGRSKASAWQSPHNCIDAKGNPSSKAFDFALSSGSDYISDGSDIRYLKAGLVAEDLGLEWGGRWPKPDFDHVQIRNWKSVQPVPTA